jgi:hypothetical protein
MSDEASTLRPQRNWGALVVALVIGVVVGGGGVGLSWIAGDKTPSDANADAAATCALVRRASQPDTDDKVNESSRWTGAWILAKVTAESDPRYQPLADALLEAGKVISATYEAKGPDFERAAQKARDFCDGL